MKAGWHRVQLPAVLTDSRRLDGRRRPFPLLPTWHRPLLRPLHPAASSNALLASPCHPFHRRVPSSRDVAKAAGNCEIEDRVEHVPGKRQYGGL